MEKEHLVINLYRKVICSLTCIEKRTSNNATKNKAINYINRFIDYYDKYFMNVTKNKIMVLLLTCISFPKFFQGYGKGNTDINLEKTVQELLK